MPGNRAADKQDTNIPSIAVTLVGEDSRASIKLAALGGPIVLPAAGLIISSAEYFGTLGITEKSLCTVVILNTLDTTLSLVKSWYDCGTMSAHPASFDLPDESLAPHRIPGRRADPTQPGKMLYGVGCYQFHTGAAVGCGGVMEFAYGEADAAPFLGITWMHPEWSSGDGAGVCVDMSSYSGDAQTFYNATANAKRTKFFDTGAHAQAFCWISTVPMRDPAPPYDGGRPYPYCGSTIVDTVLITVLVEPA